MLNTFKPICRELPKNINSREEIRSSVQSHPQTEEFTDLVVFYYRICLTTSLALYVRCFENISQNWPFMANECTHLQQLTLWTRILQPTTTKTETFFVICERQQMINSAVLLAVDLQSSTVPSARSCAHTFTRSS